MARMLIQDGDECLWNVVCDMLESEGSVVLQACNDYEGLPPARMELMSLTLHILQYVVVF